MLEHEVSNRWLPGRRAVPVRARLAACCMLACAPSCAAAPAPVADQPAIVVQAYPGTAASTAAPVAPDPLPVPRPALVRTRLVDELDRLEGEHAGGMKRVGEDGFSDWQDAVEKDFEVQAAPGTCLTIVAAAEGTDELELSLVLRLPMPTPSMPDMVVAQDALQGPRAVLGPHPNCFRSPLPIPIAMVGRIKAQGTRGAVMWRVLQR